MKIQFSRNQQYQLDAIQATVDLFEGQPLACWRCSEFRYESLTGLALTNSGAVIRWSFRLKRSSGTFKLSNKGIC